MTTKQKSSPKLVAKNSGLVIDGISKSFKERQVLKDVSLQLRHGEVVGLLGPNGAGKTTCFYIISGLIKPDRGHIRLNDEDITNLPMYRRARKGISYLPQESSIFRGLSVEDNIRAILEISEEDEEKRETMLESLLSEFSIQHIRRSSAMSLSGGERRRTEIARSLAAKPSFILLDEPLAGVDPIAVRDIREVKVFGRNADRVKAFCHEMSQKVGTTVRPATSREETVRGSDIIVIMTRADEPLFDGAWLEPGQFISATGANALNRREIDLASVKRSDLIVVDSVEVAAGESGDLLAGVEAGIIYWENIPTLGDVIIGRRPGRTSPEQVTLYESHGMALQDLYTGRRVLELATARGLGTDLPFGG